MSTTRSACSLESLFDQARARLAAGQFTAADLQDLRAASIGPSGESKAGGCASVPKLKQRLMYLHAVTPSIYSGLCAQILHEPVAGYYAKMDPMQKDPEYKSVHHALTDGWRVVHFPHQRAPFDDQEIDVLGYEFILEKLEHFND